MARRDETGKSVGNPKSARRRWPRRLLGALVVLGGLAWAAPILVGHTPLVGYLARQALADLKGSVRIGGASLGWFSPPVLEDVEVRDAGDGPLLLVPRVQGSKSLLGLLWDSTDLGTFRVERPVLTVVCTRDSSNIEQALAHWLEPTAEKSTTASRPAVRIDLVQARVTLRDDQAQREWAFEDLTAGVTLSGDPGAPVRVQVQGGVREGERGGRIDVDLSLDAYAGGTQGELKTDVDSFPLAILAPLARRVEGEMGLAGSLSAKMEGKWGRGADGGIAATVRGQVAGRGLAVTGLGTDQARLDRLDATGDLALEGGRLLVRKAEASCDLGKVSLAGTFAECPDPLAYLDVPGQSVAADLDLARLVEMLHGLVSLDEDLRLTSGKLSLRVAGTPRAGGVGWEGHLHVTDLVGRRGKEAVAWQAPVHVDFRLAKSPKTLPVIEDWRCDSGSLRIGLEGSAERLRATVAFDLDRLAAQVAPIFDLGPLRPGGSVTARATLHRTAGGGFQLQGQADVRRLQVAGQAGQVLREQSLAVRCSAAGTGGTEGISRLDDAALRVQAGEDFVDVVLLEPVAQPTPGHWGRVRVQAGGDLGRWLARARPWVPALAGWQAAGAAEWNATVRPGAEGVDVEESTLAVRQPRIQAPGLDVNEPALEVKTSGRWRTDTGRLEWKATRLNCPTLTVDFPGLQLGIAPSGELEISGGGTVQANLGRVQRWFAGPVPNAPETIDGILAGRVDLSGTRGVLGVSADLAIDDLVVGNPRDAAWREPRVHLAARGRLEQASDLLKIEELNLETSVLACSAAGQLAHLSGSRDLGLSGQLRYDLQKLEPHLRPFLGQGVQVRGQAARPFRLQGSLAGGPAAVAVEVGKPAPGPLAVLTGEASLGWTSAQAYGCEVGAGDLKAALGGGWLRVEPVESTVNQGRLRLDPAVRLDPGPMELYLGKGTSVDHFRLTPAACASALGYALPGLANVVEAEGELSVALDSARVPLAAPAAAEVAGRIVVHSGRIGPGSLVRELGAVLKVPAGATFPRDSVVPFRMANGRIYHGNMELVFPELTVRTRGSVGIDGSLDLLAETSVPPKWLGGNAAKVLGGQPIRLPIRGTLASPKIDEQALRAILAEVARQAAQDAIGNQLERGLQDLLKPRN